MYKAINEISSLFMLDFTICFLKLKNKTNKKMAVVTNTQCKVTPYTMGSKYNLCNAEY